MFLCLSISFIISISEMRSARSLSVALSGDRGLCHCVLGWHQCSSRAQDATAEQLPLSILTATVTARSGHCLSMPYASARTTCPKQPSPRGFPSTSLPGEAEL